MFLRLQHSCARSVYKFTSHLAARIRRSSNLVNFHASLLRKFATRCSQQSRKHGSLSQCLSTSEASTNRVRPFTVGTTVLLTHTHTRVRVFQASSADVLLKKDQGWRRRRCRCGSERMTLMNNRWSIEVATAPGGGSWCRRGGGSSGVINITHV